MMKFFLNVIFVIAFAELAFGRLEVNRFNYLQNTKYYGLNDGPPPGINSPVYDINAAADVEIKYITQPLNHFDPQDDRTFEMRYMEYSPYLVEGGPIFIFVGGEWTISNGTLLRGHMHDMARDLNGTIFYTEHRYYGETRVVDELTTENLRHLNIDQALADLAHFIVETKANNPMLRNSGVIIVGCSYSATMVTWFMQKYPHLANGAWASSAPLKAKIDFTEYKETVAMAIEKVGGAECARRIGNAIAQVEKWVAEGNSDAIEEHLFLCERLDLNNRKDVENLFFALPGRWSGVVQYHDEYYQDIQDECDILTGSGIEDDVDNYVNWYWHYYFQAGRFDVCMTHRYELDVAYFNQTSWSSSAARSEWRQWMYQTCAEYGWYQTSGNETFFGSSFPVDNSLHLCHDAYGHVFTADRIHRNADRTNVIYGAKNPSVRNVYSVHGELDPWRPMGVQEDVNVHSPTVICPLESHCPDLGSISSADLPDTRASKERLFELVKQWLGVSSPPVPPTEAPTLPPDDA